MRIRASQSKSTGYFPYELMTGRAMRTPTHVLAPVLTEGQLREANRDSFVENLFEHLKQIHSHIANNMVKQHRSNRLQLEPCQQESRKHHEWEIGDQVMPKDTTLKEILTNLEQHYNLKPKRENERKATEGTNLQREMDLQSFQGKSLIFPGETVTSYVKLHPRNFIDLSSFTLCLRAASNVKRGYALFSYATSKSDNELLLWHNDDGTLSVYFGSIIVGFSLPMLNDLLNHICVTWESETGLITFWINGVRSLQKFGHQGGVVHSGGTTILGQEQDTVGGKFDIKQCFVGEISDVNLWDHVVPAQDIKTVSQVCHFPGGNIINWASIQYESAGTVSIKYNNDCTVQN
uniref:mucosal pentraxin-like n=1 Tax=Pristiophorus japonicus TaxID=55135 RepID=UPI00398E494B